MATKTPTAPNPWDAAARPTNPFGLPLGSVRGIMAILILSFFWVGVCWPSDTAKLPLGHFFLLPLVLFSFALPTHRTKGEGFGVLPIILRLILVGGSILVGIYAYQKGPEVYQPRMTPRFEEFVQFWLPFGLTLAGGFFAGHVFRLVLGPTGVLFVTGRAWLGVVSLVMLAVELALLVMLLSSKGGDQSFIEFLRFYQFVEVGVVSAYFGTRL